MPKWAPPFLRGFPLPGWRTCRKGGALSAMQGLQGGAADASRCLGRMRDLKLPDQRHPEKAHRPDNAQPKKPDWIRVKAPTSEGYKKTRDILREKKLVDRLRRGGLPQCRRMLERRATPP
jgi:hypothetical protein